MLHAQDFVKTCKNMRPVLTFSLDALRIDIFEKTLEKSTNGFVIAEAVVFDGFTLKCGALSLIFGRWQYPAQRLLAVQVQLLVAFFLKYSRRIS